MSFHLFFSGGVGPDGVAPSRMVSVSASVNLLLHHKVQKFSSGTDSPGWSRKKSHKTVVVVVVAEFAKHNLLLLLGEMVTDYNSGLA